MPDTSKELTLKDLSNDSFFNALKNGEYCLVLGAGFSYGLKNKSQSEFDDEKFIPIVRDFVSLTIRKFKTSFPETDYNNAADQWQRKIESNEVDFSQFKNLFLVDESEFNKKNRKTYSNILAPNWSRIYTFNFDNVLDVLIGRYIDEYEIHNHDVGSFSSANKIGIGYLHNSIIKANGINDLVFTNSQYAQQIFNKDNHLYFSLLNDIEKHHKNLLIIGCGFVEQSVYAYLHSRINRTDLKIIHINFKDRPNYGLEFEKKVKDIIWINCTAESFLQFLSENLEKVSKHDFLPKFLELLKIPPKESIDENISAKSFNDFLDSQHLKYYSRGAFKQKLTEEIQKEFLSENDFLKFVTEDTFYGLIIHGQGGIGKTRLMLELGKRLLRQEFIVIKVLPDFESLDELVKYFNLRPTKKYLLLFDYIEEQKVFDKTIKWIIANKFSNIKIIGNCRNTFVSDIQNIFSAHLKFIDIGFKNKIGLEKKLERDYKREVILSIINSISDKALSEKLKEDDVLKSFYQARPSFAAFIKYIHLKNPNADLSITTDDTFSNWLIKKLKLTAASKITFSDFFEKKKHIFQILSCLPAQPDVTNIIEQIKEGELSFANEVNKLIHDGWIDETNQSLKVVHDTVNDTLLLEFFKHFQFRDFYLINFLEFALTTNSISSMMWSIQRVWDEFPDDITPSLQRSIAKFIDTYFNEEIAKENWFKYKLDNTHLISEQDRINFIIKQKEFLKENFALEKFGSSLAFSIEWVYENISDAATKKIYSDELYDLFINHWNQGGRFNDFVEDARGGKIISSYINLFGIDEYIKDRFNEYIGFVKCNVMNLEPISLAVVSWFNQNGEANQELKDLITSWINVYQNEQPDDVNPTYLINCCLSRRLEGVVKYKLIEPNIHNLKSSGNYLALALRTEENLNDEIKPSIISWFEIYEREKPENINPTTLAFAWLEKGDDSSIIRNVIQQTLLHPYKSIETKAKCIGLWLEKSNDLELVEPFIEEILSAEIFYKTAYYIIGYWLAKSDNSLLVKPFLRKWLNNKSEPLICSFLFQNWLNKGDDPNIIIEPIKKWLQITSNANAIGNVFTEFIYSNGNIAELRNEIIEWLNNNSGDSQSVSILGFLLEKNIDESLLIDLEIPSEKVFKLFATQREIGFCIGYWIAKGGRLSIVEPYIKNWLRIFGDSEQGCALIGNWLEKNGNFSEVKEFIVPNLQRFTDKKNISQLMLNWIQHGDDPYLIKDFIEPYFSVKENQEKFESRYLITNWLEKTNLPILVRTAISPWLSANCGNAYSIYVCSFWLKHGNEIELVKDYLINHFSEFIDEKDSNQVIENWIEKGGDLGLIKTPLLKYIERDRNNIKTLYAVVKWINHKGSLETLTEFFKYKFINYCHHKVSFHTINSWLNNGGDFQVIKPSVIKYLWFFFHDVNAVSLLKLCIKLNKLTTELEVFVFKVIEIQGAKTFTKLLDIDGDKIATKNISVLNSESKISEKKARELSIKIKDHLKNGQSPEQIKKDVIEFLTKNGNENLASHVIATWIEYGNDFELVKDFLNEWIDNNLLEQYDSSFVLSAALENEKGFKVVHDKAIEWLNHFGKSNNAKFPLSSWLKLKGNEGVSEIEHWIIYWAENLYDPTSHNWRDDLLLDYCKD